MARKVKKSPRPKGKVQPGQLPGKSTDSGLIAGKLAQAGTFGKVTDRFPGK